MLKSPLRKLKGVGPQREARFNNLGIKTIKDLFYYFPFRYQDRRNFKKIKDLSSDQFSAIKAKVVATNLKKFPYFLRSKKIKSVFEATLEDGTGSVRCVWFNQAYLSETVNKDAVLIVYGKPKLVSNFWQIISPEYVIEKKDDSLGAGKIVGVYRLASQFTQKFMRNVLSSALKDYFSAHSDPLPYSIRKEKNIFNIVEGLEGIHFPDSWEKAQKARKRFIFEELFFSQMLVYLRKAKRVFQKGAKLKVSPDTIKRIKENLGFDLTFSQEEALSQILSDLKKSYPMHRLLQGDVGCGKTAVITFAVGVCVDCSFQAAVMVPTEVLAYQHKETLEKALKGLKFYFKGMIKVITSSLAKKEIEDIHKELKQGKIKIIVGTHSLIQEKVKFKKLGLAVIDEQHRFGVAQRALLPMKGKISPHCLVVSATPIPRSLALSLYGDLDFSVIAQMPEGRKAPKTQRIEEAQRPEMYDFLKKVLSQGRQAYIVYPVIEESQEESLKSLKVMYKKIVKEFSQFSVKMLHGRMKTEEKISAIKAFKDKKAAILVSTTVIEVGLDIKNATVMVVENPERFGLAQLHQLRGRIQRSEHQPHFILISKSNISKEALRRLEIISEETSGFKIAEEDLKLRGPGDFFGSLQHGLPDLKIADPRNDLGILKQARISAYEVIKKDPYLEKIENRCLRNYLDPSVFLDKQECIGEEMKI